MACAAGPATLIKVAPAAREAAAAAMVLIVVIGLIGVMSEVGSLPPMHSPSPDSPADLLI